jgi:hypothetical protein
LITTPAILIVSFIAGHFALRGSKQPDRKVFLYVIAWFWIPVVASFFSEMSHYGGWRHLYFVYPAFILIALAGVRLFLRHAAQVSHSLRRWAVGAIAVAVFSMVLTSFMLSPRGYAYFSELAPMMRAACDSFDKDYFGISYKEGFEYILAHDPRPVITVDALNSSGVRNIDTLPLALRARLAVATDTPDYYLTNYGSDKTGCVVHEASGPEYVIRTAQGVPILSIFPRDPVYLKR